MSEQSASAPSTDPATSDTAAGAPGSDASTDPGRRPIRRALVSVYDKTGLEELARGLHEAGVALVSTGGSAALLEGRVKTLHPRVHAGILADTRKADHLAQLVEMEVEPFELVVVNLYPFRETVASGAAPDEVIEQIDIGGPSMVRAAAKNHPSVAVITDPAAYPAVLDAVAGGGFTLAERKRFAAQAFAHTAAYDVAVASWCAQELAPSEQWWPEFTGATWERRSVLRYGENPHQKAALYAHWRPGIASAEQLHGKEMSYNNYVDADAAVRAAHDHGDQPTVAVVKHANPCGIAVGADIAEAHRKAHECDPVSAFGGIIATNRPVSVEMARTVADIFTEVVVAPGFDADALEVLTAKKNIRLLQAAAPSRGGAEIRPISGGLLMQHRDGVDAVVTDESGVVTGGDDAANWRLVSGEAADEATLADLQFAWRSVRAVKSNAILLAAGGASVGIGMGQVNRVDSCHLAVSRANSGDVERARGAVAASDAFFPFADGLQVLLDAGVRAVVAPGGSMRDGEVIEAAAAAGVTMYFTGTRHFAH